MRTTRRIKTSKCTHTHKVRKKRHKSRSTLGFTPEASFLDLENINEVLRVNRLHIRNQRADGKGSWKVVPKDSCEVYKDRQKRQAENNRREEDTDACSDSDETASGRGKQKRREDRKSRRGSGKNTRRKQRPKCRHRKQSSLSSYTTTTTSCMSSSEMDYE